MRLSPLNWNGDDTMTKEQLAALAKSMAPVIRDCVEKATSPLLDKIASLETELASVKTAHEGAVKAADLDKAISEHLAQHKEYIDRVNVKGARADEEIKALSSRIDAMGETLVGTDDVAKMVDEARQQLTDQIEQDAAQIKAWMDDTEKSLADISSWPAPKDGKDADPVEIARMVDAAVKALPAPQDGKSVTVDEVEPLLSDLVSAAVADAVKAIPAAKDGIGLAGALIDRDGNLVVTLSNGEQKELGPVVGKDAEPSAPGEPGLGFDDMDMVFGEDGVALVFSRGEQKKAFALPLPFDRGVFKEGTAYRKGNGVTWGGSFWIAQKDNPEGKPDMSGDWRLVVKKGRDARPSTVSLGEKVNG
jgi:hypothetical protein